MDKLLAALDPSGRDAAIWLVQTLRNIGLPLVVVSGRRSADEQLRLVPAPGLPKASPDTSRHVQGRAFDLGFRGYQWQQVPPEYWRYVGELWERMGGRWGGRFRRYDPIHFDW